MSSKPETWRRFCDRTGITATGVDLFATQGAEVQVMDYGKDQRRVLRRSAHREGSVIAEVEKVPADYKHGGRLYDGLIYMMYWKESNDDVTPLPVLRRPMYFWTKAWQRGAVGPWEEFGSTSLTFQECLVIGLAGTYSLIPC